MTRTGPSVERAAIPRAVWALGFVSLFMDVSSEMVHALLPVFLTGTLGASVVFVGIVEGAGEATAAFAKLVSGAASDWLGRRKLLILIGYGLGAASKPIFAMAPSAGWVLGARFADRVGKGIRGAPRDALIADVTPEEIRGRAFGLRQGLDTAGAFAGPLIAVALMLAFSEDMRLVFWCAAIPGAIAVLFVVFGVEDVTADHSSARKERQDWRLWRSLPAKFWRVAGVGVVFTLARFSEAFLILRAQQAGLSAAFAPMVLVVMNAVYAIGAYPAGAWADRMRPEPLLVAGLAALLAADAALAWAPDLLVVAIGLILWGAHMALTQGLFSKLVADAAPPAMRATAFGVFNAALGAATLAASVLAGALWDALGPATTFLAGASFAAMAALGLLWTWRDANLDAA